MSTNDLIKQLTEQRELESRCDKWLCRIKADTITGILGVIIYFITLLIAGNSISVIISTHIQYIVGAIIIITVTIVVDIRKHKNDFWRTDTFLFFIYFVLLIIPLHMNDLNRGYDISYLKVLYPILIILVITSTFSFLINHNKVINKKKLLNNSQEDVFFRAIPSSISRK